MLMLQQMVNGLKALKGQNGQALLEYALILCVIVIVVGFTLIMFGQAIVEVFIWIYTSFIAWCGCL